MPPIPQKRTAPTPDNIAQDLVSKMPPGMQSTLKAASKEFHASLAAALLIPRREQDANFNVIRRVMLEDVAKQGKELTQKTRDEMQKALVGNEVFFHNKYGVNLRDMLDNEAHGEGWKPDDKPLMKAVLQQLESLPDAPVLPRAKTRPFSGKGR